MLNWLGTLEQTTFSNLPLLKALEAISRFIPLSQKMTFVIFEVLQ